jgi:hypothetical protein
MRKKAIGLVSLTAPALIGLLVGACDDKNGNPLTQGAETLCGPCGTLATGDVGISGNAKLDGFFSAVAKIGDATGSINADFAANIDALAEVYGVANYDASASIDARVDKVIAAIKADFSANLDGGVTLKYTPAECHASINVAVEAQAHCEAKADCDVKATPGNVEVDCQGSCSGSCMGTCEGALPTCQVDASAKCEGKCEGTCTLDVAAKCEGTCHGECSGNCSVQDANGQCNGTCDAECKGSCELSAAAECSGSCSGKCEVAANAMCEGGKAPSCSGTCKGKCDASCTGEFTPPSASANCDATADCQAQAKAQANASLECTPPSVDLAYSFSASAMADAGAQADFVAHLGELKARGGAILQGFTKYTLLIKGDAKAGVKSPVAELITSVQGLASASGEIVADIPPFRLTCALAGFTEAGSVLSTVTSQATANLAAQGKFATAFTGGFK